MPMLCASCGYANPGGMRYCGRCGTELAAVCSRCNTEMPAGFVFCGRCGARLGAEPEERPGETRQVTVLFADISGFTALAEKLGPAELPGGNRAVLGLTPAALRANAD